MAQLGRRMSRQPDNDMVERIEKSLYIKIGEAKDITAMDIGGTSDAYCIVKIDYEEVTRTTVAWKTLTPFWGEESFFKCPVNFYNASVYVYDADKIGKDEVIGKVSLDLEALQAVAAGKEQWYKLQPVHYQNEVQGQIEVETLYQPMGKGKGTVEVNLLSADKLAVKDANGFSDPFCKVHVTDGKKTHEKKSDVRKKTLNPKWLQRLPFEVTPTADGTPPEVRVSVWDWDRMGNNDFMGEAVLDLAFQSGVPGPFRNSQWYPLRERESTKSKEQKNVGSLRLKVEYHEDEILFEDFYSSLLHLLNQSIMQPASAMPDTAVGVIEAVTTTDRERIARDLVRTFTENGTAEQYLKFMLSYEVQNTIDPNTLFRGNSLTTKSLDVFMKMVGGDYLKAALKDTIDVIFEENKSCEIDPTRLKEGESPDDNLARLILYFEKLISNILCTVPQCPVNMCSVFRHLQMEVKKKWPEQENESVRYTSVSGFLFLRFFAPAVLGPKLFGLKELHAGTVVNRTLTLLSKALQNLGNLGTSGVKEQWMSPLNGVVEKNIRGVRTYIDGVAAKWDEVEAKRVESLRNLKLQSTQDLLMGSPIIKEGWLNRRKQGSKLVGSQYSKKYIKLTNNGLMYYKDPKGKEPRSVVSKENMLDAQKVPVATFGKKYMLKLVQRDMTVYLQASDAVEQDKWLDGLRSVCTEVTTRMANQGDGGDVDQPLQLEQLYQHLRDSKPRITELRSKWEAEGLAARVAMYDEVVHVVDELTARHKGIREKDSDTVSNQRLAALNEHKGLMRTETM